MARYEDKAEFKIIDHTLLSQERQAQFHAVLNAQHALTEAKRVFSVAMNADNAKNLGTGKAMVFGFKYDKLSVATVDRAARAPSAPRAKVLSLVDYLAQQAAR